MVNQTTAPNVCDSSPRKTEFCRKLSDLNSSLIGAALLEDVWKRLLTDEERVQWDSPKSAHANCGNAVNLYSKAKGISFYASIIELWRNYNLPDIDYNWLCRELFHFTGERVGPLAVETDSSNFTAVSDKPVWDSDRNELWFQGKIARTVRGEAVSFNIQLILDSFQKNGWPARIADPLPNGPDPERLRATIASLNGRKNTNSRIKYIKFIADGSGKGISWKPFNASTDTESEASN